jgi:hypothetical protein
MAGDLDLANIGQVMAALDRVTSNAPLCSSSTFKKSFFLTSQASRRSCD